MPNPKTSLHSFAESLKEFRQWLGNQNLSKKTIKNYVSDVHRWSEWAHEHFSASSAETTEWRALASYRSHLENMGSPESTIKRHFASLRRFNDFLAYKHPSWPTLIHPETSFSPQKHELAKSKIVQRFGLALRSSGCKETTVKNYVTDTKLFGDAYPAQSFDEICRKPKIAEYLTNERRNKGLTRSTVQRKEASLKRFCQWAAKEEFISENPYQTWFDKQKQAVIDAFTPLALFEKRKTGNLPSSVSGGKSEQVAQTAGALTVQRSLLGWYDQYHSWKISSYLHLGILVVFSVMIGLFGYQQFYVNVDQQFAYPSEASRPGRILNFQGRLTDSGRTPITTPINFTFRLYDAETSGNVLWDSSDAGACSIDPDQDGIFSILLGESVDGCGDEITENVFSENTEVWLEVQVSSEILSPRQRIASVPYALNSETVQGFPVDLDGGINSIPVINALGEIIIGADNPSLIASSGAFLIQGESLLFQTETGSDGDISFQPDGEGSVQVLSSTSTNDSLYISNSNLTSGNLIRGEVGNDNTTHNLISLAGGSSLDEKFVVDALGNTTIDGYLAAPGATLSATYAGSNPLVINGTGGQILTVNNNGQLSLDTQGSSGGIVIGGDTNIYRSAADTLATDDSFTIGDNLTVTNNLQATILAIGGISPQTYNAISDGGTASQASTDNDLYIEDILEVGGQLFVNGQEVTPAIQLWQENQNVLSPANSAFDLAIGGTATSSAVAQIFGIGEDAGYLQARGATLSSQLAHRSALTVQGSAGQTANLSSWQDSSGNDLVVIDESGNLGIGSANPGALLDVGGNGGAISVGDGTDASVYTTFAGDRGFVGYDNAFAVLQAGTGNGIQLNVNNGTFGSGTALAITSGGNIGIGMGTTAPGGQLEVRTTVDTEIGQIIRGVSGQSAYLSSWRNSGGSDIAYISSTGNLAVNQYVGSTSDADLIELLSGQVNITGNLATSGDIAVNGDDITSDGNLRITPTGTLTLNSTGNATIDSSGDIILDADGADIALRDGGAGFATFSNFSTDLFLDITGDDFIIPDRVTIGQTSAAGGMVNIRGGAGNAALVIDERGTQNILTASASGTTVANLDGTGNLFIEGSLADLSDGTLSIDDDLQVLGNDIYDSTGVAITFDGSQNITTYGTLTLPNSNTLTGLANYVQFSNGISVGGGTTYYVDASGNGNLNNITGAGVLDINGVGTSDIAGTLNLSGGTLTRAGGNLDITTTTSGNIALNSAGTLSLQDGNVDYAIPLSLTDTNLDLFDAADRGIIDALNYLYNNIGSGGGGGDSYWSRNSNGLLSPNQSYESIAVGGSSTASAKFHVNAVTGDVTLANGVVLNNQTTDTLQLTASTAFDIDSATLDLSTQNVDVSLATSIDALNFGSDLMSLDTSNGRVGIGTAAPNYELSVAGTISGSTAYRLSASEYLFGSTGGSDEDLLLAASGFTSLDILNGRMVIDENGNVGIGTTSPASLLNVEGGFGGNALVTLNDTFGNDILTASSSGTTRFTVGANGLLTLAYGATIDNTVDNTLALTEPTIQLVGSTAIDIDSPLIDLSTQSVDVSLTSGVDALNFGSDLLSFDTSNTFIGVGTAAPGAKFHVVDGSGGAQILMGDAGSNSAIGRIGFASTLTSGNYSLAGNGSDTYLNTPNGGDIHFRNNDNTFMLLDEQGFLRIGSSTAPTSRLALYQDAGNTDQENGITWGNDTNLFRPAANVLKTEDQFVSAVGIVIDSDGDTLPADIEFYVDGDISLSQQLQLGNYAGDPGTGIGSGALAYDSSNNVVKYFDGSNWLELTGEGATNWYFNEADTTIYPRNLEADLLIGGGSTASAKFHVNADTGDITARAATFSSSVVTQDQLRIGNFGTDPTAIGAGSLYFNTSDNQMYLFDGTQWGALSSSSGSIWYLDTADGVIRPSNITPDILIGGYSTDSAKIRLSQADGSIWLGEQKHRIYEGTEPITGNANLQITSTGDYLYVEPDLRVQGGDIYKEYQGDVIITLDEDFDETRFSGLVNATDNIKVYSIGEQSGEIYTQNTGSLNKIWTTSYDFNASGTIFQTGLQDPARNDELKLYGNSGSLTQSWTSTADFETGTKTSGIEDPSTNNELALATTDTDWSYRNWNYRQPIDITYTGGETLQEYQVLLDNIDTASLISGSKMESDCSDMRFGDDAGNELNYYIVENTCNTADTEVWVQTESFTSSGETIYMFYGNSSATSESSMADTFSYDSERTIGYVVHDTLAASTIDIFSMMNGNSITIGSGTVALDQYDNGSLTAGFFSEGSAVSAKGLFQADADVSFTDTIVPVSFASKEFAFYDRNNGINTICMVSPWGTANYTIYAGGSVDRAGSVTSSGTCIDTSSTNNTNIRVTSDIPILAVNDGGAHDIMPLTPLVKNEYLYGIGSQSLATNAGPEASTSNTTEVDSAGGNRTFSLSASSSDLASGGNFGAAPASRLISTDASISAQQHGDSDGIEATMFYERKELSTVWGAPNGADYISVAAPYASTTCSVHQGASTIGTIAGGSNTTVNHLGFGTGNSSSYVTDNWRLECDKPVYAYYQQIDTDGEHNMTGYAQMRQFTYPTPAVASPGSEETVDFATGDETWTSASYDAGAVGNFLPASLLINWTLDGSDNTAPQFQILGSNTGAFAGEETIYPNGGGSYYQDGGTYDINDGVELDVSGQVNTAHRYWRVRAILNTGATTSDTPTVQDISLIGSASFLPGERSWTSNYIMSGTGHQTQDLSFGQPNRFKATWDLDGTDNIAPKFQIQVSTNNTFAAPVTLPDGDGTYYQDGGTYDINSGEELDITADVAAAGSSMNNWNNDRYYWRVLAYLDTGSTRTDTPVIYDIQLRNHRPLILQQYGHDVGIGIVDTEATLHVEATNSGDVFKLTNEGEQLLKVDVQGNVEFGSSTNNDVKLTVYGDIFSPDETRINTDVTSILGSYLYDTSRDSDGGNWRKSSVAKTLSWYRERKDDGIGKSCTLASDDRCGNNHFPTKANIVWTADELYIFDISTNSLWMKFEQGSGNALGDTSNNDISSVTARDGHIYVGTNGTSSETGIYELDFTTDTVAYWDTTDRSESTQTISERNSGDNVFSENNHTRFALTNNKVNDLDITYHANQRHLGVATDGGLNVVNLDQPIQYEYRHAASALNSGDTITDDGSSGSDDAVNAFDFDETTYVRSDAANNTLTVTYQFASAKAIQRYGVRPSDNTSNNEAPEDWTFQASNNGSSWTTLETVTNAQYRDLGALPTVRWGEINSSGTAYSYYRIVVTDPVSASADQVWIADMFLQTKHEKSAVKLYGSEFMKAKPRASSARNTTTISTRHINDWRRTNNNGEFHTTANGDTNGWVQVSYPEPLVMTQYGLVRSNDANSYPADWTLYGSNDAVTWTSLDTRSSQTFDKYVYKSYTFSNSTAYQHYRLDVSANGGDSALLDVSEFQMGAPVITASSSNNDTTADETNVIFDDAQASGNYRWLSTSSCSSGNCSEWIRYDYGATSPRIFNSYAVKGYVTSGRQIEAWALEGSNDGSNWTSLHSKADTGNPFSDTEDILTYTFSNSTAYRYYRLNISRNGGDSYVETKGFWLLGDSERMFSNSVNGDSANSAFFTIDRGDHSAYNSQAENNGDGFYVERHFPYGSAQTVSGVRWQASTASDVSGPRDITVSGSNDRLTWTELATRDGMGQIQSIHFGNSNEYQYYRFTADANNGGTQLRIDELSFVGGRYQNVRFSGSTLVGANASKGTVDIFYNIWNQDNSEVEPDDIYGKSKEVDATADVSLDSTPGMYDGTDVLNYPALTGIPEYNTKYAMEVDGGKVYFGHRYGTDIINLATTPDPDFLNLVGLSGSINTTHNVINQFGLSHYYPMETSDSEGKLNDYGLESAPSYTLNLGDADGNPTPISSGAVGRAMSFDSSQGDYVAVNDNLVGNLGNTDWAVGGWVYLDNSGAASTRHAMGTYNTCAGTNCYEGWYLGFFDSNSPIFGMCPGTDGGGCPTEKFETQLTSDAWHHVVVQERNNVGELYINGELRETFSVGSITDGGNLQFGSSGPSNTNWFQGDLDEMFLHFDYLTPNQIAAIYRQGSGTDSFSASDADIASSTTIGKTTLSLESNKYSGLILEITGGTGAGQTRLITKNNTDSLTVAPAWSTFPDSTSDFRVRPWALPGSTSQTKALRIEANDIFVGLNDGSNGGGVVRLDAQSAYVTDYYHASAGKTDDAGTAWDSTSGYDNVVGIETTQDNLLITSSTLYWREKIGDTLFEAVDKLQQAIGGTIFSNYTQDDNGTDSQDTTAQVIRKGWSWLESNDTSKEVHYGISYNTPPLVFLSVAGSLNSTLRNPTTLSQCTDLSGSNDLYASSIRENKFTAVESIANTVTCFTWMSIGSYNQALPEGNFSGGADLAEWYGTDDTSLQAGEIVSVDPSGDIKVVRSDRPQDSKAIGIIATQPAITLGDASGLTPGYDSDPQLTRGAATAVQVALAGRVPVKVSLENGPIEPGDYLTTGSTPGVAVKAISAGPTIGKAMERFDGTSTIIGLADANVDLSGDITALTASGSAAVDVNSDNATASGILSELEKNAYAELDNGIGTIMAFVNTSYFDPSYDSTTQTASAGDGTFAIDGSGKLIGLGAYSFDIVDVLRDSGTANWNVALGQFGDIPTATQSASPSALLAQRESVMDAALARLKTLGTLALRELNVANARVMDTLFARNIETDNLAATVTRTNMITPLENADVIVEIGQEGASESGQFAIFNQAGEQLATIDNSGLRTKQAVITDLENRFLTVQELLSVTGNASISGNLTAQSARFEQLASNDASISGTLYANRIEGTISSDSISGLEDRVRTIVSREREAVATSSAEVSVPENDELKSLIASLLEETATTQPSSNDDFGTIVTTPAPATGSTAWNIAMDVNIDGIITAQGLSLNSALLVNGTSLSGTELAFSSETFAIQSTGTGRLSLMADAVVISENGGVVINEDVIINGRTTLAGETIAEQSLFASLLQPLPNNNLEVQLASSNSLNTSLTDSGEAQSEITPSEFVLRGIDNQEIAAFSASGSSRFRRLIIAAEEATSTDEEISTSVVTNSTTGTGTIAAGQTKFVVRNTVISNDSLIYLTPTSSTKNRVLYIGSKSGENPDTDENEGYFEVVLDGEVDQDVSFNWWIIN